MWIHVFIDTNEICAYIPVCVSCMHRILTSNEGYINASFNEVCLSASFAGKQFVTAVTKLKENANYLEHSIQTFLDSLSGIITKPASRCTKQIILHKWAYYSFIFNDENYFNTVRCVSVSVTYRRVVYWIIGFTDTLYIHNSRLTGNYRAIADLHTFTVHRYTRTTIFSLH
jgi:hypothetical protein